MRIVNGHSVRAAVVAGLCAVSVTSGATLHVPADWPTIQGCINAARNGDECVVAPGTYNEVVDFLGKAITLRSSEGAELTIIDATGMSDSVVKCISGEGADTVLDGFTITGGTGTPCLTNVSRSCGGGMYNNLTSPTVTGCTFHGNTADRGGGMYIDEHIGVISDCTFIENTAGFAGGGLYSVFGVPTMRRCRFVRNTAVSEGGGCYATINSVTMSECVLSENNARFGGGMYSSGRSTLANCSFHENTSEQSGGGVYVSGASAISKCIFVGNDADFEGGALRLFGGGKTLTDCMFLRNSAGLGAGIAARRSDATIARCSFLGNASSVGGGLHNDLSGPLLFNCVFSGNSSFSFGPDSIGGSAVRNWRESDPIFINCVFSRNAATGAPGVIHNSGQSNQSATNCIFWDNLSGGIVNVDSTSEFSYCNFQVLLGDGSIDNGGNINVDPLFVRTPDDGGDGWGDDVDTPDVDEGVNDDFGDLRSRVGALTIDLGNPDTSSLPGVTDFDGGPRVLCGRVDMGAFEFGIGDYDCNGVVDLTDLQAWDECMTGPATNAPVELLALGCEAFDYNADNTVDLTDFAAFAARLSQ